MEPLDPQLRQLIDEGLPSAVPSRDAEGRGLAALLAEVEGPPPLPDPTPAAPVAGLTKLALVVAAAGAIAAGGWVASRPDPTPTLDSSEPEVAPTVAVRTPAPQPKPKPEVAPVPELAPVSDEAALPIPARRPQRKPGPAPTPADALRAEAELIARAESALDRSKPREALALCDMHRDGFDAPQLATEREAIGASAACLLDPSDTAAAQAFVRAHSGSALATKVRQRCALEKTPPP